MTLAGWGGRNKRGEERVACFCFFGSSLHSLVLSDTTRRGTLSKNRKYCLSLAKIKAKGRPRGLGRFSDSPKASAEASDERPKPSAPPRPSRRGPLVEAPPRKASAGIPILRFVRGWARQTISSPPSRPTPLTERHVQLMRPTTPATSGTVQAE